MVKIYCITYKYLDDLVREAINKIDDENIEFKIVQGLPDEIVDDLQNDIEDGIDILLAGGANAKVIEEKFNIPILRYKISDFDYFTAIQKGYEYGEKIAIVTYQTEIPNKLKNYLESQNLYVENIIYEHWKELEDKIKNSESQVIIGASHAVEVGKKYNKKVVLIYPGVESIIETINDGKMMALEIQKIKELNQYSSIVLNYTSNGVLLIDSEENIIDLNSAAEKILNTKKYNIKGKKIDSALKYWCDKDFIKVDTNETNSIINIGDQEFLQNIIKTGTNPMIFEGAVIILSKLDKFKKAEIEYSKKQRQARKLKGFEAKKYFSDIIGNSYNIKSCIEDAKVFAKSNANILIYGETGVGKELFAQGIHNYSLYSEGPFIAINCGALTESLLEAELFGYEEGSFTGSKKGGKKGLFELADGGTIFLDEVGEISYMMQTKLLRVLQEHEIMRVGGEEIIPINVRVISATNRNLEDMSHEEFRRDLLYRLNVLELSIPPLCERNKDSLIIFEYFYKRNIGVKYSNIDIPKQAKELITIYSWPGNIREMHNVCERFCLYLEQVVKLNNDIIVKCMIKAIGEQKILKSILSKYNYDGKNISKELVIELKNTLFYSREKIAKVLHSSRTTIWRILKEENVSKNKEN